MEANMSYPSRTLIEGNGYEMLYNQAVFSADCLCTRAPTLQAQKALVIASLFSAGLMGRMREAYTTYKAATFAAAYGGTIEIIPKRRS